MSTQPTNTERPKRRPRRHNPAAGDVFGDFTPRRNPAAVYAYRVAMVGLIPLLGIVLGPAAIALGVLARIRRRRQPEIEGVNFANAAIVIGMFDLVFNAAGIACLMRGLGWW